MQEGESKILRMKQTRAPLTRTYIHCLRKQDAKLLLG